LYPYEVEFGKCHIKKACRVKYEILLSIPTAGTMIASQDNVKLFPWRKVHICVSTEMQPKLRAKLQNSISDVFSCT
jgi:hypothetical protein